MNRGQVAGSVRANKERHPERYCSVKNCLWNTTRGPCQKHPHAPTHMGRVTPIQDDGAFSLPEVEA